MTAQEQADAIIASDAWRDPAAAVGEATTRAAQAAVEFRHRDAKRLTQVAALLVVAADNPNIPAGAVLTDLLARYGA
jgi:hypothetical protein